MEPDDNTKLNDKFSELSSLIGDVSAEPDTKLTPTQAISEDGTVVELGENGDDTSHKDI